MGKEWIVMNSKVNDVATLYTDFWPDVESIKSSEILAQFLRNVDLPAEWFANKECLDVGCGSGFAVWAMEAVGASAYACDLQVKGVKAVQDRLVDCTASDRLVCGSALELPFKSDSFDFVHCNGVLHHTQDPYQGFLELERVTRPGGTMFISLYGRGGLYNAAITICRLLSGVVPFGVANSFLTWALGSRRIPNSFMPAKISVLDNMYVPIRYTYREPIIMEWFKSVGIKKQMVTRTATTIYDHRKLINRLIHGSGYLQYRAQKP